MSPERQPEFQLGDDALAQVARLVDEWPALTANKVAELRLLLRPFPVPQEDAA